MRVISVNVNGIRAAKRKGFFEWLKTQKVDFCVCRNPGPRQYNSKTGHSGLTAIIVSTAKQKRKVIAGLQSIRAPGLIGSSTSLTGRWLTRKDA